MQSLKPFYSFFVMTGTCLTLGALWVIDQKSKGGNKNAYVTKKDTYVKGVSWPSEKATGSTITAFLKRMEKLEGAHEDLELAAEFPQGPRTVLALRVPSTHAVYFFTKQVLLGDLHGLELLCVSRTRRAPGGRHARDGTD
eukprot:g74936.t1